MLYLVLVEYLVRNYKTRQLVRRSRLVEVFASDGLDAMEKVASSTRGNVVDFFES